MKASIFFLSISLSFLSYAQMNPFIWKVSNTQPSYGRLYETTMSQGYLSGRSIRVWVPEGYEHAKKPYEVVYFHDGQMLFDSSSTWNHQSWDLANSATNYLSKKHCILVGIDNDPNNRYAEFFPSPIYSTLPVSVQLTLRDSLWNGLPRFDSYAKALINEVFPFIEKHCKVNPGGAHRTMVGSSMGGVVSLTFLLTHPTEISGIACLSLHLPLINYWKFGNRFKDPIAMAFNAFITSNSANIQGKRLYVDRGDQSLDAAYVPYFPAFESALNSYSKNNKLTIKLIANTGHSERDWAARVGPILKKLIK
ncbi:MAG: alpha/beta hydrolase [Flavobacteriales bacterium]